MPALNPDDQEQAGKDTQTLGNTLTHMHTFWHWPHLVSTGCYILTIAAVSPLEHAVYYRDRRFELKTLVGFVDGVIDSDVINKN